MELAKRLGARVERYKLGEIIVIDRTLEQIDAKPLIDYVQKHIHELTAKRVHETFPELTQTPRDNLLFFDTENCGLSNNDPVFLLAMAHMNKDLKFQSLLARDYSEEKTLVEYFQRQLPVYRGFVTFNGQTFDIPRLNQRAIKNGLIELGSRSLSETMESRHLDLYSLVRTRLPVGRTKTLQTLEKVLFNFHRKHDIPGEKIPAEYRQWIYEGGNDEIMERIVNHNFIDTLSIVALFTYLCCHK